MNDLETYIEHCAGVYNFLTWIEEESIDGMPYEISNQVIKFNNLISRYFSLGVAINKKKIKEPFLAIQPSETEWFKLICWDKVILKENDDFIYFLSKIIKGDQEEYPDIPAFAIALYCDTSDKKDIIKSIDKLSGREYYRDNDNGEIHVNFHKKVFNLPIEIYSEHQDVVMNSTIMDYSEIMAKQEFKLQNTYTAAPEFIGDSGNAESALSEWRKREENIKANTKKLNDDLDKKYK